jgi:predicted enzyme related to lactoylglutathione lyase
MQNHTEVRHMKDYDNFFLPSGDLKKGKAFYQGLLGLPVKFDFSDMGMVAFKVGENEPAIILKDTTKFPQTKPTIWFVVDNVQEEHQRLAAKGLKFLSPPFEIHTGMAVEFEDPFGNRLGLTDYSKTKH